MSLFLSFLFPNIHIGKVIIAVLKITLFAISIEHVIYDIPLSYLILHFLKQDY